MADSNAIVVDCEQISPVKRMDAPASLWRQYLEHMRLYLLMLKRQELRRGLGVNGGKLKPVKPISRPDGADGPPLSPHQARSRSQKWLRASIGHRGGTVTLWWSHGWGRILGYHREGNPRLPSRDVIGFTAADHKRMSEEARRWWQLMQRRPSPKVSPKQVSLPPAAQKPTAPSSPAIPDQPIALEPKPMPGRPISPKRGFFRRAIDVLKKTAKAVADTAKAAFRRNPPVPPKLTARGGAPSQLKLVISEPKTESITPKNTERVVYLKPGEKPNPKSKKIQVYEGP